MVTDSQHNMLFITGFPRSGTTLLERIMGNQANSFVAHQAFPNLFLGIKKEFLLLNNVQRDYPFIPKPTKTEREDFLQYLLTETFSAQQINGWIKDGNQYPAFGEPRLLENSFNEGSAIAIIKQALNFLSKNHQFLGFKDVMMDEFIPYFTQHNINTLVLIRDPRAVIASLIHSNELGDYRPTLFNLQLWKRTVKCTLNSAAIHVKYEDLVHNPQHQLERLANLLNRPGLSVPKTLKDNNDNLWKGNSSFQSKNDINAKSTVRFREVLNEQAIQYVESICSSEMDELGYTRDFNLLPVNELKEPFKITHRQFQGWDNHKELIAELNA